jgi:hypothetical protein
MLRKKNSITKLIMALGVLGLMIGFSAPRANAQAPHAATTLSTANYTGRYVCLITSRGDFYTAVVKYNPNGAGIYGGTGTLIASADAFLGTPSDSFCTYNLNPAVSSYSIDGHGLGFEKLVWNFVSGPSACPAAVPGGVFTDDTAIALRNLINNNGAVVDSEISDGNLLGQGFAGHGYCLK